MADSESFKKLTHLPMILGHRGGRGLLYPPENSLAAFEKVLEEGADGIELDVFITKDKQLVVFHDDFMHQLANTNIGDEKNAIELFNLSELDQSIRLRKIPKTTDNNHLPEADVITEHKIPRLNQVLDLFEKYKNNPEYKHDQRIQNFLVNIEIKESFILSEEYKTDLVTKAKQSGKAITEELINELALEARRKAANEIAGFVFDLVQSRLNKPDPVLNPNNFMISSFDFSCLKSIQQKNLQLKNESRELPVAALICKSDSPNDTDQTDVQNGIYKLKQMGVVPVSINLPVMAYVKNPILGDIIHQACKEFNSTEPIKVYAWPYKEKRVSDLTSQEKKQLLETVKRCKIAYFLSDNPIEMKQDIFTN